MYKRRGISPIIAVILIIGLTVLAFSTMLIVVLPLINPSFNTSAVKFSYSNDRVYIINGFIDDLVLEKIEYNNYSITLNTIIKASSSFNYQPNEAINDIDFFIKVDITYHYRFNVITNLITIL